MYNQCFGKSTLREVQNFETKRMYNENGGVYFILVIAYNHTHTVTISGQKSVRAVV